MPDTGARTILCYGDSNTWGYDPASGERFSPDTRWTGVLERRDGRWLIIQMHFSFAADKVKAEVLAAADSTRSRE